jgi:hypothetical protein
LQQAFFPPKQGKKKRHHANIMEATLTFIVNINTTLYFHKWKRPYTLLKNTTPNLQQSVVMLHHLFFINICDTKKIMITHLVGPNHFFPFYGL